MSGPTDTVTLPSFFRGPETSANGGYAAGVAARLLGGPARVRLRKPPPLDHPLAVRHVEQGVDLLHGDDVVVSARPATVDIRLPEIDLAAVRAIAAGGALLDDHLAPGCVVCGPARPDGYRLFPGRVGDGVVGCSWTAPAGPVGADGALADEVLWAALDCPGGWAILSEWSTPEFFPALVDLAVEIRRPVQPAEPLLVVGWRLGAQERRHHAGSALLTPEGEALAMAAQTCYAMPATWASS